MAALSTQAEYDLVREAIQTLTITGQQQISVSMGDMSASFSQSQLPNLMEREKELARRLSLRNARKRVTPDFTGTSGRGYL